jgi:hypothetical protein
MKTVLTNIILVLFPFTLLAQVAADTSFLFEEAKDDFHEFRWQSDLEISNDSTLYYLKSADNFDRLELIDSCNKIIWKSESIEPIQTIPIALVRKGSFTIRIYGELGVTEVIWHP